LIAERSFYLLMPFPTSRVRGAFNRSELSKDTVGLRWSE